ncbi:MAG TPA: adenosine kinase [Rhodospirillaceae bacterium]|nr:adenosine kinase [Rhodospirillaceae bacterium]
MVIRSVPVHPVPAIYDVCAVGNAIVDVISDCDEAFLTTHSIVKGSMTLIDEERADYLYKAMGPGIEMSGGSIANSVAGMAALGGTPTYIGKVKDDQFGGIFRHDMRASGVHYPTPPTKTGPATARCLIMVTPDAERSMSTFLGACVDLSPEDIDRQQVANAQITFLEGYLFDKPKAQEAFRLAAKIAHDTGRRLALTLSDTFCVDRHREGFRELIKGEVDILIANEFEMMALYQVPTFEEAMEAARAECSVVAGTRSEKGAVIVSGDETYVIEAEHVPVVVDSTGAGDLFAAGLLYGMTHGQDLPTSGRIGALAAAEVISHYGPRPQRDIKEMVRAKGIKI